VKHFVVYVTPTLKCRDAVSSFATDSSFTLLSYSRFSVGIAVMRHIRSSFSAIVVSYLVHKGITQKSGIPSEGEWFQMERRFV
jgi:hypothetical protein